MISRLSNGYFNWKIQTGWQIQECQLCQQSLSPPLKDFCSHCLNTLPPFKHYCEHCAVSLTDRQTCCGICHTNTPLITKFFVGFRYHTPLKTLILKAKFSKRPDIALSLANLLIDRWLLPQGAHLMPVPLDRLRLAERGFNVPDIIAKELGNKHHLPVKQYVRKKCFIIPQSVLSSKQRSTNLKQAFTLITQPPAHVMLIDDICTTGNTLLTLAQLLKQAGCQRVDALVIAKANARFNYHHHRISH